MGLFFSEYGAGAVQAVGAALDVITGCRTGAKRFDELALDAGDIGVEYPFGLVAKGYQDVFS